MKIFRYICLFLIFIMLAGSVTPVSAQDYRFQVPDHAVVVTINADGTISIDYTMTFVNDNGAHPIDIVDIGLPNYDYDLKSITAEIDGKKIGKISASDIVSPGISLYLQSSTIPAGGTGKVHAYIPVVKNAIYPATQTESESYASLEFWPHWYDSANCYGKTNYQMTIVLPPGLKESEGRYYVPQNWPGKQEPETGMTSEGRIFYTWVSDQADKYTQYSFGASFPDRLLPSGTVVQEPYVLPTEPPAKPSSGFDISMLCPILICIGFLGFFILMIYSATIGAKKRKMKYLPPKILIEGNGVKRGLTAVEAGVLMEQPMDKIFTMILFALLKKGAAEVITKEPLELKPSDPLPADLYGYETDFLAAFNDKGVGRRKLLQTTMVNLIKTVTEKMKGFSRKETIAYYDQIMKRAWSQVEQANTPEVKAQAYEENMDWTMLDPNYDDHTKDVFSGPILVPTPSWWWRYDPAVPRPVSTVGTGTSTVSMPSIGGASGSRPTVSMPSMPGSSFAASVVNSVSSFSAGVLGGLTGFTSGVTSVTNPPPPPSTYRSSGGGGGFSGGGGHSCACACACAGCACACAGGGR